MSIVLEKNLYEDTRDACWRSVGSMKIFHLKDDDWQIKRSFSSLTDFDLFFNGNATQKKKEKEEETETSKAFDDERTNERVESSK